MESDQASTALVQLLRSMRDVRSTVIETGPDVTSFANGVRSAGLRAIQGMEDAERKIAVLKALIKERLNGP